MQKKFEKHVEVRKDLEHVVLFLFSMHSNNNEYEIIYKYQETLIHQTYNFVFLYISNVKGFKIQYRQVLDPTAASIAEVL